MPKVIVTETPACGKAAIVSSTPWETAGSYVFKPSGNPAFHPTMIASCQNDGTAALIVKAVNSHEALVKALANLLGQLEQGAEFWGRVIDDSPSAREAIDSARAALKLAGVQ